MKTYSWKLRDIIMVALLAVAFGVIYLGALYFAYFLGALLTPMGLSPLSFEIVFGVWFMASTLAAYIMQKPGVALVTEVLAAVIETLMGNFFSGPLVIVSGFIQGAGAEAVFAARRYKKWDMPTMCLAALGCAIASFPWSWYRLGYGKLSVGLIAALFVTRLVSSVLFSGVLCKLIGDALLKTGLLKSYALGKAGD